MGPCEDCRWWGNPDPTDCTDLGEMGRCKRLKESRRADEWCEEFVDRFEDFKDGWPLEIDDLLQTFVEEG